MNVKPCPFCGSRSAVQDLRYVHCTICGARGPIDVRNGKALERWNRRHKRTRTGAPVGALAEALAAKAYRRWLAACPHNIAIAAPSQAASPTASHIKTPSKTGANHEATDQKV